MEVNPEAARARWLEQLEIELAILWMCDNRHELLDTVYAASSEAAAKEELRRNSPLTELQVDVCLAAQFRRFTLDERTRAAERVGALRDNLEASHPENPGK
ncbi:hypothetical protein GCM10027169_24320 [Gordonia jinhuaensis]|uniref:Uncharacterized protein n=1 Tax=Gordonia jinhuaensis TaxID=1517702 RepID=A0A916WXB1_9ACTN|nr:hypothetical protein GCM10011489_29200 [Gordonia jinhuaensis]